MNVIDLLLTKDCEDFLSKSKEIKIKSLSKLLGQDVVLEMKRMSLAQEDELNQYNYKPSVDKSGNIGMKADLDKKKLLTINYSVFYEGSRFFSNKSLLDHFGVGTPSDLIKVLLTPDEIDELVEEYDSLINNLDDEDIKN